MATIALPGATERSVPWRGMELTRLPELADLPPLEVAERLHDLPGLTLFESARRGRRARWSYLTADPLEVLEAATDGPDPFAGARRLLGRLADPSGDEEEPRGGTSGPVGSVPPFTGGLAGFLSYDLGRRLERLPDLAARDQGLHELRLALYDQVVAWDHHAHKAWLVARPCDGDRARMAARREAFLARVLRGGADRRAAGSTSRPDRVGPEPAAPLDPPLPLHSNLDRSAFMALVERVREEIARGEVYQVNIARRLEAPFKGDPWPLYRLLRTGDPVAYAAFVDLAVGPSPGPPRALLSASPEPFLSLTAAGEVATDPIKGTRPRGGTREEDRALARELLGSAKDRAENTMIVDVLRNDLGRVCRPGTVRVPRLCRLERTGSVQHLVSTVTGRLLPGCDAFHLLAAAFPGGSITGAPKIRAMELIETLEPVRRGPYTGCALWLGADGAMGSSILIRTFVADGARLTLHVGGGMTWRSDPAAEWDETGAKARGPLSALGAREAGTP
ncbi:MAG: anthranilate synthase component I family protein [Candidatus Limnocylindrales bacterium]